MSALIFRLRNVPEDEADAVRNLMEENNIDWYETSAGNWGIAMPGIWVRDQQDVTHARSLIAHYQQERRVDQQKHYQSELDAGNVMSVWQRVREKPLQIAGILAFCLFILYVTINPFLKMISHTN